MRKDLDLDLEEEIRVELEIEDDRVADLVDRQAELIKQEVRAEALGPVSDGHRKDWDVEGTAIEIAIAGLDALEQAD